MIIYIFIYIHIFLGKLQRPQPASLEMRFSNGFVPPNIGPKFGWWTTILNIGIHQSTACCICIYLILHIHIYLNIEKLDNMY